MSTFRQIQKALALVVRESRQKRDWSLRDMERTFDLNKSLLSRIENATANPTVSTIEKLAAAFGQTPADFLRDVETRAKGLSATDVVCSECQQPLAQVDDCTCRKGGKS